MNRLLFALVALCAIRAEVPSAIAIRNARIVPVSSPAIAKGTVVLRNGLIEAVGAEIPIPSDAWVIEGDGLTVYPGLIDALSSTGMPDAGPASGARGAAAAVPISTTPAAPPARGPEDRPNTTSWLRAADLVKPSEKRVESARDAGFTTAVAFPMHGIFAGQGAVIDLTGENGGEMVVVPSVGQYVTLTSNGFTGGYPGSLMGVIAYIRQIYIDAGYYQKAKAAYAKDPRSVPRPAYDRALEGVIESPRVLLPVNRRIDIDRMLRFAAELKLNPVLYGPVEGYRSADLLKGSGVPVLLNLKWPEKAKDGDPEDVDTMRALENRANAPDTAAVFAKSGVKFAFYTGGIEKRADVWKGVKKAIDAGLTPDDALRAMTLSPAEIYGVSDRMGSIEKGKIANLVVTKGDLFQTGSEVKYVIVDGVKFEPTPEEAPKHEAGGGQ
ncbi:MAG: amidohydrolase family protein [Bryobacteraceae bacterium]|jgi:imidazolonepropionase-like amidohydrolase